MAFKILANQVALAMESIFFLGERQEFERAVNESKRMKEFEYLTSAIGHEIGNCIQTIGMIATDFVVDPIYLDRYSKDKELEEAQTIRMNQIIELVKNIRMIVGTLGQYIKNEQPLKMQEINIRELIEQVVVLLKIRNKEMKQMDICIEGNGKVWGNASSLQSILYNMLNNSYDAILKEEAYLKWQDQESLATYKGKIEIIITQSNTKVEIHVKDNGIGLTENAKEKIFATPLFTTKGHDVRKNQRISGRIGIGMYSIRKMLSSQNGSIEIARSQEHQGADFVVKLPSKKKI